MTTISKSITSTLAYLNKSLLVLMRQVGQQDNQAQAFLEQLPVRHHDTLRLASGLTSHCVVPRLWEILVKWIIWVPRFFFRRAAFLDQNTFGLIYGPQCVVYIAQATQVTITSLTINSIPTLRIQSPSLSLCFKSTMSIQVHYPCQLQSKRKL